MIKNEEMWSTLFFAIIDYISTWIVPAVIDMTGSASADRKRIVPAVTNRDSTPKTPNTHGNQISNKIPWNLFILFHEFFGPLWNKKCYDDFEDWRDQYYILHYISIFVYIKSVGNRGKKHQKTIIIRREERRNQTCFCQPSRMSHFCELPDVVCQKLLKKFKKKPKITNIWQKMFMSGNAVIW